MSLSAGDLAYRLRRALDHLVFAGARGIILLYHRVADEVSDPYGLCVTPAHFEQHLRLVREVGDPMGLTRLTQALRDGDPPDRAISITFDDGYLDNFEQAAPLLERYDVPATIFVTTGTGGREREFWWDELERVFLQPGTLPDVFELEIAGEPLSWDLGPAATYTSEDQLRSRGWHLDDPNPPTRRHAVFRDVYFRIRPLPVSVRAAVMDRLIEAAGLRAGDVRPTHRVMQPGQVASLSSGGLVQIGAHTVNHPDLPSQDRAAQHAEMATSKTELEAWTGGEIEGFAYPYGLYDDASVDVARANGFRFACAGDHQLVRRRSELMLLPRIDVPVGDGEAVARLLHRWHW